MPESFIFNDPYGSIYEAITATIAKGNLIVIATSRLTPVDGGYFINGGISIGSEDLRGFHRHPVNVDTWYYLKDNGELSPEDKRDGLRRYDVVKHL